ncbi:MAG: Hsp20/alpha crystallin family protein [Gammaproteobacteria bacterium]
MSTVDDLKHGLSRVWDSIAEGWREFTARAGDALTRFNPVRRGDEGDATDLALLRAGNRWGVLAADVRVHDDAVEVSLEVPGMEPDDFVIDVHQGVLAVRGERRFESSRREGRFHVMERAYGHFERALELPVEVDDDNASASYRHGVLTVTLPRSARTRARRIAVRGS